MENAVDAFSPPLSSDELAGLALEAFVESRIIEHRAGEWRLHHGPFSEKDFQRDGPWSLLVQAVDRYLPQVAALRRLIDFIPQWRIDDVMVSYSTDGGSVGPHYDNYDVFLLQGEGRKRWQLGQRCDASSRLLPHAELRILENFDVEREYLLNPGDVLYVPPGVAHCGVARGAGMTYSIGFRAPSLQAMAERWVDELLAQMDPEQFYGDAGRDAVSRPGEILSSDFERARSQLQAALDIATDDAWFGELVTEPRDEPPGCDGDHDLAGLQGGAGRIALCSAAKLAWQEQPDGSVRVFANGERLHCEAGVIPWLTGLCGDWCLEGAALDDALADEGACELLNHLIHSGVIHVQR